MNKRTEYLLECISEECGETVQAACKCLRFGLHDSHPKTGSIPNIELLGREFNDIVAVAIMLGIRIDQELIRKKQERVEKYIKYSENSLGVKINE